MVCLMSHLCTSIRWNIILKLVFGFNVENICIFILLSEIIDAYIQFLVTITSDIYCCRSNSCAARQPIPHSAQKTPSSPTCTHQTSAASLCRQAHSCPVSSLLLLSEVTLLSGGEKDRKICAWDCAMDYDKRAEARVRETLQGSENGIVAFLKWVKSWGRSEYK